MDYDRIPNLYAAGAENLSEEQWDKIIGKWTETPLSVEAATVVWNEYLDEMEPVELYNSLHVVENVYVLNGVRHSCIWSLDNQSRIPSITIQMPRIRKEPKVKAPEVKPEPYTKEHREWLGDKLFPSTTAFGVLMAKVPELHGRTIDLTRITDVELIGKVARELIKVYETSLRPFHKD